MRKERAIRLPMTGPNMLAALEGRKRMTRRVMKPQPREGIPPGWLLDAYDGGPQWNWWDEKNRVCNGDRIWRCPYGVPGDPLVLTETWRPAKVKRHEAAILYKADGAEMWREIPNKEDHGRICNAHKHGRWMPPMFMQVWASRAPTVNKDVRVERVQEITREDVHAEGAPGMVCGKYQCRACNGSGSNHTWPEGCPHCEPKGSGLNHSKHFRKLWDSINGRRSGCSYTDNPYCWVVGFKRVRERK